MSFRGGGRYAVALVILAVGGIQAAVGLFALLSPQATAVAFAFAIGKTVAGLVLLSGGVRVARLQKRGLWLSVVGGSGVVVIYLGPLLAGQTTPTAVGSTLVSLCGMLYLLLYEDAFDTDDDGRELTEDTNTHEFVR